MSDLRAQLQKHYDSQSLPAARVEAMLAAGEAAARDGDNVVPLPARRRVGWTVLLAMAASVLGMVGVSSWWLAPRPATVSYASFAPHIVAFMGHQPPLTKTSQNPEELRSWLIAQGAPASFAIPSKLRGLKSFGCQVVDVEGRPAYLTCFWSEKPDVDESSLVHLLVAKTGDFRDVPTSAAPQFRQVDGWSFAGWSQGEVLYTMAAPAPMERLQQFVKTGRRHGLVAVTNDKPAARFIPSAF